MICTELPGNQGQSVANAVEQLAAERLCCPTIGFEVIRAGAPTLRIQATPAQLDVFESFLTTP